MDDGKIYMMDGDGDEVAKRVTNLCGWVSRHGRFFGDDAGAERTARWDGATHKKCDTCDRVIAKSYIYCDPCSDKRERERWEKLPRAKYDGKSPVNIYNDDQFFNDYEEFLEWCEEEEAKPEDIRLVLCQKVYADARDPLDLYEMPDECDVPKGVQAAFDAFLKELEECKARDEFLYWEPINVVPVIEEAK